MLCQYLGWPACQVEPGVMWTFEQEQSFALTNVATVVRMTVIKLRSGGLWVYAPIAPTRYGALGACWQ